MDEIKAQLEIIPELSGSYQFFDAQNTIIYIGKAKNLKKRVSSYFNKKPDTPKLAVMIPQVSKIEYIITDTEVEALILESHLIRKYKPKYNILLKDDKNFPYFVFTDEEYPRIIVARKRNKGQIKGKYFGPYTDARAMYSTLELIKKLFPLKQCKTPKFKSRPCIYHQIGRCCAPCQKLISAEEYNDILKNVQMFLSGKQNELVNHLKQQMEEYSKKHEYEKASRYRDSYFDVLKTMERQKIVSENTKVSQDIIAITSNDTIAAVTLIQIRNGRLIGKKDFDYQFSNSADENEIMLSFLREYYELSVQADIPAEIIIKTNLSKEDIDLYSQWLSAKVSHSVKLKIAKAARANELIQLAQKNSSSYLDKLNLKKLTQIQNDYNDVGAYIQEKLKLSKFPHRVECFDISHIQGTNTVASMVVFENGFAKKSAYKRFKIRTVQDKPDDFKSLQEVVQRRYKRLLRSSETFPDLIIIDGGKGQLSSVLKTLDGLEIKNQDIISLAKRLEEIFVPHKSAPIIFPVNSPALYFFQRIRDEAHRFAINYHRLLREKSALGKGM